MKAATPVPQTSPVQQTNGQPASKPSTETNEWVVAPEEKTVELDLRVPIAWQLQLLMIIVWTLACVRVGLWFDSYWGWNLVGSLGVLLPMELYRRGREHDRRTRIKPSPFYFWF